MKKRRFVTVFWKKNTVCLQITRTEKQNYCTIFAGKNRRNIALRELKDMTAEILVREQIITLYATR